MEGEEVKTLQTMLNKHGYKLTEDDDFGVITQAAVKDYQRSNELVADGIVGAKTWSKLYGE